MTQKVLLVLLSATIVLLLIIVAFLAGLNWSGGLPLNQRGNSSATGQSTAQGPSPTSADSRSTVVAKPGEQIQREGVPNLPPTPKPVANPDRIKQNLQPGKTYVTHAKGVLNVRGEDKDWVIKEIVTINYGFEANIDREIESNDGKTIGELRHFRDVRSLKVESRLEDVRIDLGPAGDALLAGIALFQPDAASEAGNLIKAVDGVSLMGVINALRWVNMTPEKLLGLDQSVKAFTSLDRLTGKKVRLTYEDGKGVINLEPIKGDLTAAERDFLMASVLVSDSLIVPDADIKVGHRWSVDGSNLANLVDPSLLARISGEITLERQVDQTRQGKTCRHLKVAAGRLLLDDSDSRAGRIGHFDPEGSSLYFSPQDQIIVEARLKGRGKLEKFSKDHLLFEARMRHLPELEMSYTCRVQDTLKVGP